MCLDEQGMWYNNRGQVNPRKIDFSTLDHQRGF